MPERDIIDISRPISEKTAVWPGDTPFSREWVMSIPEGMACNTGTITMSAHCGTHADSPHHYADGARKTAEIDLGKYMGRARVVQCKDPEAVRLSDIEGLDLSKEERLLFRTAAPVATETWRDDFSHLSVEVARAAAEAGLALVGMDSPSVDPMTSKTLDAHHALHAGDVMILENLDLSDVAEGVYELIALPLRLLGGDASPVRAILRPWSGAEA